MTKDEIALKLTLAAMEAIISTTQISEDNAATDFATNIVATYNYICENIKISE